jgi:hypothetical protein
MLFPFFILRQRFEPAVDHRASGLPSTFERLGPGVAGTARGGGTGDGRRGGTCHRRAQSQLPAAAPKNCRRGEDNNVDGGVRAGFLSGAHNWHQHPGHGVLTQSG